ncbi:hypothetical protein L0U85_03340 [Glycomyces sp. L485]|uniref:hypothetical protein n=1 Tax=Glycomyces sp. L485 TaxID=2909235 RepID=UPI001F4A958F|nr:hypothetical protein [Glycomyces sp. L485]MCH7229896.1 hypothetical protein [Glycomyces sp. L485]
MRHDIIATEPAGFNWLATDTVWDRDPALYRTVSRAAAQIRWHSTTVRPSAAASRRMLALNYLGSGLIAATGAAEPTLWLSRAKPYRTKPVPFTLTGIREITAEGVRALLLLTDDRGTVPIALSEQRLPGPGAESPCVAAHNRCPGRDCDDRPCPCSCGCHWPDRLTVYRHLVVGDEATDPAWQWPFTVTADPEPDEHGGLSVEVCGDDEQVSELVFRGPTEPVIVHNSWRPDRNARETAGPEPPA